jgi:hypothetical protein
MEILKICPTPSLEGPLYTTHLPSGVQSETFLLCFAATVLTFFIAGPFYLCFEHVDNLGAYTASRRKPAFSSHLFTPTIP